MALRKKKEKEAVEEKVTQAQESEPAVITEGEKEALVNEEKRKEEEGADTQRLRLATNVVSSKFNLDSSYRVTKFDDKGKVVNLTLENENFTISVTIKDSERHGMIVD